MIFEFRYMYQYTYCAYRKIVVHLKLSLFGSCCFNTKGNILLAALKKIIANQIIQIIFLKIHNNERFCLFFFFRYLSMLIRSI